MVCDNVTGKMSNRYCRLINPSIYSPKNMFVIRSPVTTISCQTLRLMYLYTSEFKLMDLQNHINILYNLFVSSYHHVERHNRRFLCVPPWARKVIRKLTNHFGSTVTFCDRSMNTVYRCNGLFFSTDDKLIKISSNWASLTIGLTSPRESAVFWSKL